MKWLDLTTLEELDRIDEKSKHHPVLIFKHSTRCSISSMAKNRLDKIDDLKDNDCYYLDLIAYRDISNTIAERYHVHHESPQVLIIQNGECIYEESHNGIDALEVQEQLQ